MIENGLIQSETSLINNITFNRTQMNVHDLKIFFVLENFQILRLKKAALKTRKWKNEF